jgi:hypothetical protein
MVTTYKSPAHLATWKSIGAVFGLIAGLAAPILGSFFTVITWFADPAWHGLYLHSAATWLFVVTLPLLLVGAHCLDLLDKEKRRTADRQEEV